MDTDLEDLWKIVSDVFLLFSKMPMVRNVRSLVKSIEMRSRLQLVMKR